MQRAWGRFTARGGAEVERQITRLLEAVADEGAKALEPHACTAVVLIGGYGRGEGGVDRSDGHERPHNNLDLLVITGDAGASALQQAKQALQEAVAPISREHNIDIDTSAVAASSLRSSPSLVIWYDMRFGHKTIMGDESFVPSLTHFDLPRIPPWDVRNLLVNRGTLLVINKLLIERAGLEEPLRRLIVKHAMKAIIGYGDALLFFRGDYHWSYLEKQRRMRARSDVPPAFQELYDEAMEFRFEPDYARYLNRDPAEWMDELCAQLAPIHLECESARLGAEGLEWGTYSTTAIRHALFDDVGSPRAWAKKAVNVARNAAPSAPGSALTRLGCRAIGQRGLLPIIYPAVAYESAPDGYRAFAAAALAAASDSPVDLRIAYLNAWGQSGDSNFDQFLQRWNISLETGEGAA